MNNEVLNKISYGVYAVTTNCNEKPVGCIVNCVMQITYDTLCISVNHHNFTNECIEKDQKFAISILGEHVDDNIIPVFGFSSCRDVNKFENVKTKIVDGLHVLEDAVGYVICELVDKFETETHSVFIGKILDGDIENNDTPMTYAYYHAVKKGKSPKAAPTYKEEKTDTNEIAYKCKICGYIYKGDITKEPDTYVCPVCKKEKTFFEKI